MDSPRQARQLAYEFAKKSDRNYPSSWDENEMAGEDWIDGFLKRNGDLSCRKPEATSLSRGTSFNKTNVKKFHDNLSDVMTRYNFEPRDIWNMDETGLTTMHKPPKVIAERKARQVGQVTSAERGVLTTVICAVSAAGGTIPPLMIFPRVNFKPYMLSGAPAGTVGAANQSGWTSTEIFIKWLNHFIENTRASKEKPVLLLMDNHDSHVSIEAIQLAKNNGVIMLTFPPHCSHKLQPLDISVYGPLKRYFNDACNSWQLDNPGKTLTIYNMAELLGKCFGRAMTPSNITAGFRRPGISPFDRHTFSDDEFLGSYVTDRPEASNESAPDGDGTTTDRDAANHAVTTPTHVDRAVPGCSYALPSTSTVPDITPENIRPYPKAPPRKNSGHRRKSTAILTDTPVKEKLEREAAEKASRKRSHSKVMATKKVNFISKLLK